MTSLGTEPNHPTEEQPTPEESLIRHEIVNWQLSLGIQCLPTGVET